MNMMEWVICPICNNKTRIKIRKDTQLKNFPLYCPKCKKESLICENRNYQRARRLDAEPIIYKLLQLIDYRLILVSVLFLQTIEVIYLPFPCI